MIVGSGLIARAFAGTGNLPVKVCFHAAGVSNSLCIDPEEFERDRARLQSTLETLGNSETLLVYFSTCSIADPSQRENAYVQHKAALEALVRGRARHLVIRLPQVAGRTPNPHTVLNYLHARISRSERFDLWKNAARNIIDVDDVYAIVIDLIRTESVVGETIDVAAPRSTPMSEIVSAMERVTGRKAIYRTVDRGAMWNVDTSRIDAATRRCGIHFDEAYLDRTLRKYYAPCP